MLGGWGVSISQEGEVGRWVGGESGRVGGATTTPTPPSHFAHVTSVNRKNGLSEALVMHPDGGRIKNIMIS